MSQLQALRQAAIEQLEAAGVASPAAEVRQLLAHVLECRPAEVLLQEATPEQVAEFAELLARRVSREPLQYLLGSAGFRYRELAVGSGVFIPRPETELLAGWAIEQARAHHDSPALVVDLGTGSGAIAAAIATEAPTTRVVAVEVDRAAWQWARRNLADTTVELRLGNLQDAVDDLAGQVHIAVSNPPYVPTTMAAELDVETAQYDPATALWGGEDGLSVIRQVVATAARLLAPAGWVGIEHDASHQDAVVALFDAGGRWQQVSKHRDLAGRPRFVTAQLAP